MYQASALSMLFILPYIFFITCDTFNSFIIQDSFILFEDRVIEGEGETQILSIAGS